MYSFSPSCTMGCMFGSRTHESAHILQASTRSCCSCLCCSCFCGSCTEASPSRTSCSLTCSRHAGVKLAMGTTMLLLSRPETGKGGTIPRCGTADTCAVSAGAKELHQNGRCPEGLQATGLQLNCFCDPVVELDPAGLHFGVLVEDTWPARVASASGLEAATTTVACAVPTACGLRERAGVGQYEGTELQSMTALAASSVQLRTEVSSSDRPPS
mmetsp:Transcript_122637/g.261712  ORF Transcript_122637/g.261712 Transcript_122637/m.261712 type:complete len:214 (-) Transcript_122637:230-871(-)